MRLFHNDYNEICHPAVLKKMQEKSNLQMPGYGEDACCKEAAAYIRQLCDRSNVGVHFLVGGTQANLTVIAAALRPHQAAIGAVSAHINVHETGAIEATGHKVIGLESTDGKITAQQVADTVNAHWEDSTHEHIPQPKLVYISHPTEFGTTYSLEELTELSQTCKKLGLYLFVDGARLGYGLMAEDSDVTLADLAALTDVFYIGGTKVGAMFGEAVVIANPLINEDFRYLIKQRGGMLAKGWLLGIQFEALFENDLYFEISRHANRMADQIRAALTEKGYPLVVESKTNQIFAILPDSILEKLGKEFTYAYWGRVDETHSSVRFCTSWATKQEDVALLCAAIRAL